MLIRFVTFFICLCLATPSFATSFQGKVITVIDGDTIDVLHNNQPERIRLNGIDATEKGMAYGQAAKEYVLDMAALKTVTVHVTDTDRYGRTVGDVILPDGRNLNREIVQAGYAWWFKKYSKDASLGELEEGARIARKGLWRDPKPIPPWEWRAAKKNGGADNSATVAQSGTATTASASTTLYHGNTRSGVFHQVSCKDYNCKNCTTGLTTREQAISSGYKPCGMCRP